MLMAESMCDLPFLAGHHTNGIWVGVLVMEHGADMLVSKEGMTRLVAKAELSFAAAAPAGAANMHGCTTGA
jgi:hypothetical protein